MLFQRYKDSQSLVPSNIQQIKSFNGNTTLSQIQINVACKVKLGISHHSLEENNGNVQSAKALVFVLDNRRDPEEGEEKPRKRKRGEKGKTTGANYNFKNFGAFVQTSKIKGSSKILIGWRTRHLLNAFLLPISSNIVFTSNCWNGNSYR